VADRVPPIAFSEAGGVLSVGTVGGVQLAPPVVADDEVAAPGWLTTHNDQPDTSSDRGNDSSDWKNDSTFGKVPMMPIEIGNCIS
jgi:hypothetical protein